MQQPPFFSPLEGRPKSPLCEFSSFCFSAGAGRTGTFIALSNILERVKAEGLLDVFQTVKSLRTQRPHMVQTVVGGKRENVRSAARKLTAFSHLCCTEIALAGSDNSPLVSSSRSNTTSATGWCRISSTSSQTMPISNNI